MCNRRGLLDWALKNQSNLKSDHEFESRQQILLVYSHASCLLYSACSFSIDVASRPKFSLQTLFTKEAACHLNVATFLQKNLEYIFLLLAATGIKSCT